MNDLVPVNATPAQIERANAMMAKITEWFEQVPDGGGDGVLGILELIASAENPEDLDRAWNSAGFGQYLGYALRITNLRKLESDFEGGVSHYLIADAVVHETGEAVTCTTGSYAIMAQLLYANTKGWLPMDFVPHQAEEPTEKGFYPQHLKVWKSYMPTAPDPTRVIARARAQQPTRTPAEMTAELRAKRLSAVKPEPVAAATAQEAGF